MVLNRIYLIPHGDEILDLPNKEAKIMHNTILKETKNDDTEIGVIISPHSVRLSKGIAVINTEYFRGYYKLKNSILRKSYENYRELTLKIIKKCNEANELNFVTSGGPLSSFPLDFGTLIPLKFFKFKKIVLIGQPRNFELDRLKEFGMCLYDSIKEDKNRIDMIFSADQAHTHSSEGPYGYSPKSKIYDNKVIEAIKNDDFSNLYKIKEDIVNEAKPDSFWNMIILSGFLERGNIKLDFKYYYVEKYFGMLFAVS